LGDNQAEERKKTAGGKRSRKGGKKEKQTQGPEKKTNCVCLRGPREGGEKALGDHVVTV